VFASQKEREECGTIFQRFNTAVVPNGAIVPAVLITKTASKKIRLMFLGRINRIKGLENLITAMMMVDSKTFTLDIYGTGEKKYVESLNVFIGKHQLSDRVFMRGGISHSSLLNIFANTDCLVLPSHLESFGQVVVESLAHGVPVIVSTGAPWKQIDLVGCGLWVKNDSKSLASAIIKMSKLDMVKMGIRGRNWIKSDFDWSLGAQKIIALSAVEERT
jgi:glycosyltransferase involved in cell wall biosynthesis